jgi:hypothetical protein
MKRGPLFAAVTAMVPVAVCMGAVWMWLPAKRLGVSGKLPAKNLPEAAAGTATADTLSRAAARMEGNPAALLQAEESLVRMTTGQFRTACEEAANLPVATRETVLRLLFTGWAEIDPAAAMHFVPGRGITLESFQLMDDVGYTWARRDAKGLLEWYTSHKGEADPRNVMPVTDWLAAADVGMAARALCSGVCTGTTRMAGRISMNFDPARRPVMRDVNIGIASRLRTKEDLAKLLPVIEEFPCGPARRVEENGLVRYEADFGQEMESARRELKIVVENAFPALDPGGWREWIKAHPVSWLGRDLQLGAALDEFQLAVSTETAERIMASAWHEPPEDVKAQVIVTWASRDMQSAGNWLKTQGTETEVWPLIEAFAAAAMELDPAAAFAWLEAVPDAGKRETLIERAFERWRERKPDEAGAWLKTVEWPEDRMKSLEELWLSRYVPIR